ncbi:ornithine cyclodeaminase family protein [Salinicola avicenniae]|uniref:ornithine cyclodeaminase family protein n=1 Tax=Salinicola avicenniae TaxID=2916836 RepID=UPI0020747881|nr:MULTISPECIES: ornithine cyclodeaminase family protein [unclassified Salinicola]
MTRHIRYADVRDRLTWEAAVEALREGHRAARPEIDDTFLGPADKTLLNRSCFIPGVRYGAKAVTVFDGNAARGLDTVQGAMLYFAPEDGQLKAIIDSRLVTELKTVGDSLLGARLLARPDSRHLLVCGVGRVAASLIDGYTSLFPGLEQVTVWNRTPEKARALAERFTERGLTVTATPDLAAAVARADILASATMSRTPFLEGQWLRPGTHVDLIGAYKADMREADDVLLRRSRLFVDSRETTLGHIGELKIPLDAGVIAAGDILGDLYDLIAGRVGRRDRDEITFYKNGGGAHLDLMIARHIADSLADVSPFAG